MATAHPQMDSRHGCRFADTRWSVVLLASSPDSPDSRAALETLCRAYWRPLYGYARRCGWEHADAQDRVQEFLADFLSRGSVAQADRERGRFRTFLLACLRNYLANCAKASRRLKRGGGSEHVSWEGSRAEERLHLRGEAPMTPEEEYDREWALALIEGVLERLRLECERVGKGDLFEGLRDFLAYRRVDLSYEQAAESLGRSVGGVRVIVHRFRKRFRELLREEVARTLFSSDDLEDEIRALIAMLSR